MAPTTRSGARGAADAVASGSQSGDQAPTSAARGPLDQELDPGADNDDMDEDDDSDEEDQDFEDAQEFRSLGHPYASLFLGQGDDNDDDDDDDEMDEEDDEFDPGDIDVERMASHLFALGSSIAVPNPFQNGEGERLALLEQFKTQSLWTEADNSLCTRGRG